MYKAEAFYAGDGFYRIARDILPDDIDDEKDDYHWFVPYIVNLTFACELFLKSLISDGDSEVRGHNLSELFCHLDEATKSQILHSASFDGDEQFIQKLQEISNGFCEWRYYFEKDVSASVEIFFLDHLADELYFIAKDHLSEKNQNKGA